MKKRIYPYNQKTIDRVDAENLYDYLDKIYTKDIDVLIIKNVLDNAYIRIFKDNLKDFDELKKEVFPGFNSIPPPLSASLKEGVAINDLFIEQYNIYTQFAKLNEFKLENEVNSIVSSICQNKLVKKPNFENTKIIQGSLRFLTPQMGDLLSLHCGNEFSGKFQSLYEELEKNIHYENQLSYFVLLKKPTSGGELSLYNFTWADIKKKRNNYTIIDAHENEINIDSKDISKIRLELDEGDMLIFAGGEIWHRVEEHFNGERITYGGFIGKAKDSDSYVLWS